VTMSHGLRELHWLLRKIQSAIQTAVQVSRQVNVHSLVRPCPCTGWPKKTAQFLYALTSSNSDPIFKRFHVNQEKICNNIITKDLTAAEVCRYTTL